MLRKRTSVKNLKVKASKRTVPVKVKAKESRTLMLKVLKLRNQVLDKCSLTAPIQVKLQLLLLQLLFLTTSEGNRNCSYKDSKPCH